MKHVLVSLWLTGAVLFLISTSLSAVNLFGENDRSKPNNDQRSAQPAPSQPAVQHPKPAVVVAPPETQAIPSLAAERPHAISPDQPSSEPPAGYELPGHPHIALPTPTAEPSKIATLRLNSAANIRSGPSLTAPIIGTAAVGAELQVTAYDADWVQFIDPSSGKTGWVHSQSVEADTTSKAAVLQPQSQQKRRLRWSLRNLSWRKMRKRGRRALLFPSANFQVKRPKRMSHCRPMKSLFPLKGVREWGSSRDGECSEKA